jgi:hypothetical protein
MIVGEKILRAGREPFDRPAELLGHMQHERILGERRSTRTECAADVHHVHANLLGLHMHHGRKRVAHCKRALMRTADLIRVALGIEPGKSRPQLHRSGCNARALHAHAHDVLGTADELSRLRGISIFEIETDIVGNARMDACLGDKRLLKSYNDRQLVVFDLDQVGRVLGSFARLRHHHRHLLADEPNPVLREQCPFRDEEFLSVAADQWSDGRQRAEAGLSNIPAGNNRYYAGHALRGLDVERANESMRPIGALEAGVKLPR